MNSRNNGTRTDKSGTDKGYSGKGTVNLRSDTFTKPTPGMLEAMMRAEVGDDVYSEDITTNALEQLAADITGKEAALFMPSGSMSNLTALYINAGRGNEVLTHRLSHIIQYEVASPAAVAGCMPIGLDGPKGKISPEMLEPCIHPKAYDRSHATMIEIENSANKAGGTCYTLEELQALSAFAQKHRLSMHMDGARIFNAALATNTAVKDLCGTVDTITFCLSKGLGAPVGSVLCGSQTFISKARRVRKLLGGGMRQTGYAAAAGLYALNHHIDRLQDDHDHARMLAETLDACSWASIDLSTVETNIVIFETVGISAHAVAEKLKQEGILCSPISSSHIRLVTHLDVTREMIDRTILVFRQLSC